MTEQTLDKHVNHLSEEEEVELQLKEELNDLAEVRLSISNQKEALSKAQKALANTKEWILVEELLAENNALKQKEASLKEDVSVASLALSSLSNYKNRKPVLGIQIKDATEVEILDEKKAKKWAAENAPDVLSLSIPKLRKVAKVLALDFVEIKKGYKTYIASDLSEYLDEEIPF